MSIASRGLAATLGIVLVVLSMGCEKLGVDPSGKLACSPPPRSLCPSGFSCIGGRCWSNSNLDGALEAPTGEVGVEDGNADESRTDGGALSEATPSADAVSDARDADAEDAPTSDASTDTGPTCGVCLSPPSSGHATCNGTTCGIACDLDYRNCPGTQTCTRTAACCADADCPKSTPACVSGQCKARANNDPCSSDTECGSGHCAPTASAATTKVCCESDCSGSCNDGCAGGTCQHKKFRTACGEIDNSYYGPRYYLCDGNGNCNPPVFPCGGGSACAARSDVACCGDPNNNLQPACVAPTVCGQGVANFEQSCNATVDCPLGTFCCVLENPDLEITACAANCQTYVPAGFDPTNYAHSQACDYVRDSSCPNGQHCGVVANSIGVTKCGV